MYGPALPIAWPVATVSRDVISIRLTCAPAGDEITTSIPVARHVRRTMVWKARIVVNGL